jgi:PhoH-like ATPase
MPLPPAPTKRAAQLSAEAYDAPARSSHKAPRKSEAHSTGSPLAEKPLALDFDPRTGGGDLHPALRDAPADATEKMIQVETRKAAPAPVVQPAARPRKKRPGGPAKLFVLDTNVLLHDPMCLFRFEEHDIFLPMIVLEELDSNKKGMTEVARNARQTSRTLDALAGAQGADIATGLKLRHHRPPRGRRLPVLPDPGAGSQPCP